VFFECVFFRHNWLIHLRQRQWSVIIVSHFFASKSKHTSTSDLLRYWKLNEYLFGGLIKFFTMEVFSIFFRYCYSSIMRVLVTANQMPAYFCYPMTRVQFEVARNNSFDLFLIGIFFGNVNLKMCCEIMKY